MRIIAVIVFVFSLHVSANTLGQNVSIKKQNITLKEVFKELRAQTGYYFIYNSKEVIDDKRVSTNFSNVPIDVALSSVLNGLSLKYTIEDKIISVVPISALEQNTSTISAQQDRAITGKITDSEDGLPLFGVSVRIKGATTGTITNAEGNFSINVKANDKILLLSYVGYVTKELTLTALGKYEIALVKDSKQLDEVVIAFGTTTRNELTNSVTKISAKDIEQRPISNLNSAIVGASPGVQTTAGSGQPGEGPEIRIRGFGSVTSDNAPLYVLDGAPYEGEISNINPEDIDNISILKDASATALYGARAANGIVLITTKKGNSTGKTSISAKLNHAFSERGLPNYETLDAYQYFPVVWEALRNGTSGSPAAATRDLKTYVGWNPFNVADDEIVLENGQLNPRAKLLYPDDVRFRNELQRLGMRTDMSISLSGGSAKTDHYVSLNYLDENGYVVGSDFKRFSGRLRVNATPRDWLKFGLNLFGTFTKTEQANQSSGINENPFYIDLILAPIYPVFKHDPVTGAYVLDAKGNKIYDAGDYRPLFAGRNVVYETLYNVNQIRRNSLNGVTNIEAKFWKDFKFTSSLSFTVGNNRNNVYDNSVMGDAVGVGATRRTNTFSAFLNFNQILNWTKTIDKHKITVLLGHENYLNYYDYLSGTKRNEGIAGLPVLDNMTTTTALGSYDRDYKTEGYFSRLDYSYRSKYLFSASFRTDGTSRFAPESRWGNFWSVSGAYNIDREPFFKVKWIDQLKLRASYGEVGNDRTGNNYFTYQRLYNLGYNNGSEPGALYWQAGNRKLVWEANKNADVAVEFSVLKNRFGGTVEAFSRQSDNLLFAVTLPLTSGLLTYNDNFGSMRNRGLEVQLNGVPIKSKRFRWNIDVNWSTIENKILSLPASYEGRISGTKKYQTGKSLYEFWLRDWVAVNPETGNNLYTPGENMIPTAPQETYNGQTYTTSITYAAYQFAGSAIPDFFGSVNNTFTYKNWSLQTLLIYQVGGYTFDNDYRSIMFRGGTTTNGRALHVDMLKRWQNVGDITNIPRLSTTSTISDTDRWLTNSNYINLRTVAVTYNFPKKFLSRLKLNNAKAYVNGENLFITSARKGMDPTQTYTGDAEYTYAPSRIISFGLNITL